MILKKTIENTILYFEIKGSTLVLEQEKILIDIVKSLNDFKFINKKQPFNDLIKEQQKHQKFILVDFNFKPFDELKFLCKAVFNFLIETEQTKKFMIDVIEIKIGNDAIVVYGTEQFFIYDEHGYKINSFKEITFSPTIRTQWSDPTLIEKILLKA